MLRSWRSRGGAGPLNGNRRTSHARTVMLSAVEASLPLRCSKIVLLTSNCMKPYQDPEPRKHSEWCHDLGLVCEGNGCNTNEILSYEAFCFLSDTKLRKVKDAPLYGFWKPYGDVYGEPRTVREWLEDINWQIVEPLTEEDMHDLNLFLGYDEFWEWASGKIESKNSSNTENSLSKMLSNGFRRIFTQSLLNGKK